MKKDQGPLGTAHPSRRDFLRTSAAAGLAAAGALMDTGCSTDSTGVPALSAEAKKMAAATGLDATVTPDAYAPAKSVIQVRIHDNDKGRAIEELSLNPLGVDIRYKDGSRQTLDLTADIIQQAMSRPDVDMDAPLAGTSARIHVQIADPARDHIRLTVHNPEESERNFAVFVDRALRGGKPARKTAPNPTVLHCDINIAGALKYDDSLYAGTVVAPDARITGDNRNIEMIFTGLDAKQEETVREKHLSRQPGVKLSSLSPAVKLNDDITLRLGAVEVRSQDGTQTTFRMNDQTTITDAIGKGAVKPHTQHR